jgi:hypothetical protein
MSHDTIRTVFTYLIALVVIVGGGILVVIPTQLDSTTLLPFVTGAIGTVLGYVCAERSAAQGAANATPNTTYVTAEPPSRVTINADDSDVDAEPVVARPGMRG